MRSPWGVPYAVAAKVTKSLWTCPSDPRPQGVLIRGQYYTCYTLNAFGESSPGGSDTIRATLWGNKKFTALFYLHPTLKRTSSTGTLTSVWVGRKLATVKNSSQVVVAQDGYEPILEGNNDVIAMDTAAKTTYPYTDPSKSTFQFPNNVSEYVRHMGAGNALYADWHVERLTIQDQMTYDPYTGVSDSKTVAGLP